MTNLSEKQKKFANEYLRCFNATQSAIKAGYSPASARTTGYRLLKNVDVKQYMEGLRSEIEDETILTAKQLLTILSETAVGNLEEEQAHVIKVPHFIKNETTGKDNLVYTERVEKVMVKPKMADQNKARELVGKYHALWTDKTVVDDMSQVHITVDYGDGEPEYIDYELDPGNENNKNYNNEKGEI
ncbi:terminase small subunit [Macrococcus lamae]|uniref:Terminase small subunit n=1 Tax=Macrococcus lamae TaxID=198484 RepID=A0A4R6BTN7_9STAP|nr:terminase small subunit [Macrococcus lamae]TDM10455.1 terminase small subunit [Macrococcus lamae]